MKKLVRITTVPISLEKLLENQLRFMTGYYDVTIISSDAPHLKRVAESQGTRYLHVEMTRKITPLKDLKSVWELYRFFRKEKPEIVHTHTPKAGIVGMLAAKLAGVPHRLHTVAGLPLLEATGAKRKVLDSVEKLTYACATGVYPNSSGLRDIIVQNGYCAASKLKVIGNGSSNGINTAHFSPAHFSEQQNEELRMELGFTDHHFVFIFVGRLVKDKGINELVAAFDQLHQQQPHVRLLLVGDYESELDPLRAETLEKINRHDGIVHTGFMKDVRPYLAISRALAFPTYREGFPNVVLQAGAMGLPSIVTNINGCNEIIEEGVNGTIIPVKDQTAIFNAMTMLASDKKSYISMQKNAREMIVARYEQQVVWEAILNEYRKLK
ncbi:glycosyltransferase family 4 protein [Flavobacterium caeni]|uniref:Glycosyltransferase involved in cell wall bisynthesis n=1 Tax=Flavobacterium caeni TaxID=490189 RepID=A0A1G5FK18_9FLAO|nr:glycosyltransferase family 4 protein [Flavobacterium caeni]SCY39190.1 Glycosyltransferase involved in cell wall bisynthesis [Flavobacterium caeni]